MNSFDRPVCILGLGLIGGSLLRDVPGAFGYNRSAATAQKAADDGFDASADLAATLKRAERDNALIVLAVPYPAISGLLDAIVEYAPSCGFTDVVSIKGEVLAHVRQRGLEDHYVGSHPMAGTADSGWSASLSGLFKKAAWVITFDHALESPSPEWVSLWRDVALLGKSVGGEIVPARVHSHDSAVARISHLPHILAEALAITGDNGGALSLSLAASSFRDGTRVAGTEPPLVRAMCETNAEALREALDETLGLLTEVRSRLDAEDPDLERFITDGYRARIRYEVRSGNDHRANSVSPRAVSARPIMRVQPGGRNWVNTLIHAESIGAQIEVI